MHRMIVRSSRFIILYYFCSALLVKSSETSEFRQQSRIIQDSKRHNTKVNNSSKYFDFKRRNPYYGNHRRDQAEIFEQFEESIRQQQRKTSCGRSSSFTSHQIIIEGRESQPHAYPWMVALMNVSSGSDSFCGGSLISDQYVLTAAHCIIGFNRLQDINVLVGSHSHIHEGYLYEITEVIFHPYHFLFKYNDIAIIKLRYPVDLSDPNIGIICLPSKDMRFFPLHGMNSTAIGWGVTSDSEFQSDSRVSSQTLQQIDVTIISPFHVMCDLTGVSSRNEFCTYNRLGGAGSFGDSGGPLMIYESTVDAWFLAGIMVRVTVFKILPRMNIVTNITVYLDWIRESITSMNEQTTTKTTKIYKTKMDTTSTSTKKQYKIETVENDWETTTIKSFLEDDDDWRCDASSSSTIGTTSNMVLFFSGFIVVFSISTLTHN